MLRKQMSELNFKSLVWNLNTLFERSKFLLEFYDYVCMEPIHTLEAVELIYIV
jgi:hypothetical protein